MSSGYVPGNVSLGSDNFPLPPLGNAHAQAQAQASPTIQRAVVGVATLIAEFGGAAQLKGKCGRVNKFCRSEGVSRHKPLAVLANGREAKLGAVEAPGVPVAVAGMVVNSNELVAPANRTPAEVIHCSPTVLEGIMPGQGSSTARLLLNKLRSLARHGSAHG